MLKHIFTKNEAFAAVMVPYGLINAGLSLANFSGVETRIPLSLSTKFVLPGTGNEHISEIFELQYLIKKLIEPLTGTTSVK